MADARRSIGAQRNPDSERAILDAARDLLAEEGLAGFSIEAVARRARAGKPTIYRWWPDKTRLLLAVYAGLKDDMEHPTTGTLAGDVRGFITHLFQFWGDTPAGAVIRSIIAEAQTNTEASAAFLQFHRERNAETAARFWQHGIPHDQAAAIAEIAVSYAWGQLLTGRRPSDAQIARLTEILIKGVGCSGEFSCTKIHGTDMG